MRKYFRSKRKSPLQKDFPFPLFLQKISFMITNNRFHARDIVLEFTDHDGLTWKLYIVDGTQWYKMIVFWSPQNTCFSEVAYASTLLFQWSRSLYWNLKKQQKPCEVKCTFHHPSHISSLRKKLSRSNALFFFSSLHKK